MEINKMIELLNGDLIFKSLADPIRLRLIKLLIVNKTEMCVCEFVDVLCEKQYNISKHLKILENAKLLKGKKEGRWVYYGLTKSKAPVFLTLLKLISQIDDTKDQFLSDQKRFTKRISLRENGRCLIGIPK